MSDKWFDSVFEQIMITKCTIGKTDKWSGFSLGIIRKACCLFVNNVCKLAFTAFEGPLKASNSNKHCLSMIHKNDLFKNFKFTVEIVEVLVFDELGVRIEPRIALRLAIWR